ncbi:hypothetical protein [uncultured Flavobacterium sp.]|uniref:hypothetical protein n=1 Tax=uncultured Flavobacterium sp. TaxID=165435 RepID=UPI0025E3EDEB|nr:hypothetical protein [uncultured Flavobacterium sp.]
MSKNEIYDLLEILPPENDFQRLDSSQNWGKHLLIRVFSIIIIIGSILILTEIENFGTNDNLAILLGCIALFFIWFIFICIEAIVLQIRKKPVLRNANLAIIGFAIFLIFLFIGTNL